MKAKIEDIIKHNIVFAWLMLLTGMVLLAVMGAMQISNEISWTALDFTVAGALMFGSGSVFVVLARLTRVSWIFLLAAIVSFGLWLWAELAVGIFTDLGS